QVGSVMLAAMRAYAEQRRTGVLPDTCVVNYAFDSGSVRDQGAPANRRESEEEELRTAVARLGDRERDCIQALYEKNVVGPNARCPSQNQLASWAGYAFDTLLKNTLAFLVKAGFLDNL